MIKRRTTNRPANDKKLSVDESLPSAVISSTKDCHSVVTKKAPTSSKYDSPLKKSTPIHRILQGSNDPRKIFFSAKMMVCIILAMLALIYIRIGSTEVMTGKQKHQYTPTPKHSRKTYIGAIKNLSPYLKQRDYKYTTHREEAEIVWGHSAQSVNLKKLKPWQRANHLPKERLLSEKGIFIETMKNYAARTGEAIDFLPETYRLYDKNDRRKFLARLAGGGMYEAWALKIPHKDNGKGVTFLGPGSKELQDTYNKLRTFPSFGGKSLDDESRLVVQKYVMNLLPYNGRKCDLRMHCLVASSVPLVVFYHDGTLRITLSNFDDKDFSSPQAHLTNWGIQKGTDETKNLADDARASFQEFGDYLNEYVSQNPNLSHIKEPLKHVRNQVKNALATVFHAYRDISLSVDATEKNKKLCGAENGFSFLGADFMVDSDLKVWMIEVQSGPGTGHDSKSTKENFSLALPGMFEILEEVRAREMSGEPIIEIESPNTWELIYNDDFRFTYSGKGGES